LGICAKAGDAISVAAMAHAATARRNGARVISFPPTIL
jgi:hypothetical protein